MAMPIETDMLEKVADNEFIIKCFLVYVPACIRHLKSCFEYQLYDVTMLITYVKVVVATGLFLVHKLQSFIILIHELVFQPVYRHL